MKQNVFGGPSNSGGGRSAFSKKEEDKQEESKRDTGNKENKASIKGLEQYYNKGKLINYT